MSDLPELFDDDSTAADHSDPNTETMTDTNTAETSTEPEPDAGERNETYDSDATEPRRVELDMADEIGVYHHQRHRGGDETVVLLSAFGEGYQILAIDVAADGALLEVETVGDAEAEDRAVGMAEYWCQQNPKGILGGEPENEGLLSSLGFGGGGA